MNLRLGTLNLNGLRSAHKKSLQELLELSSCDVLCFQEIRTSQDFDHRPLLPSSYDFIALPAKKAGYSGLLIAYNPQKVILTQQDLPHCYTLLEESRLLCTRVYDRSTSKEFQLINTYWPSGSSEKKQIEKLIFLQELLKMDALIDQEKPSFIAGDINIAPTDQDLKNWRGNKGQPGCTPEEREFLRSWMEKYGLVDSYRFLCQHQENVDFYTWWSYRQTHAFDSNIGWRIDTVFANLLGQDALTSYGLIKTPRCSDHGLYWVDLRL